MSPHALLPRDEKINRLIGIGLMCLTFLCFTGLDTTAKWLNHSIPTIQIVWARYSFSVVLVLLIINPKTKPGVLTTKKPLVQIIRSLLLLLSTLANFVALNYLQLAQTTTIALATPLLVSALSGPLLGESVPRDRFIAIGIGFLGVVSVARPGFGGIHPVAILSILGMCCYAGYALMTRFLVGHDQTETTLVYSGLVGAVILSFGLPFFWESPPDLATWALMLSMGLYAAVGHFFLITAHRFAPAYVLSPFMYTQLGWMTLSGYLVFGDVPDSFTIAGGVIIVLSGLYLIFQESRGFSKQFE
ncbi:MAG: DMT family transporter [Hyphomicrobiales bacterium]|jgi:drug/metabolite transporter (DMT)-like permease|nr:DMT family transporter [Hyphomicrobiales bacterium]NBR11083.1 DMT family transporter [Alphaproteobacteria bacterium]